MFDDADDVPNSNSTWYIFLSISKSHLHLVLLLTVAWH